MGIKGLPNYLTNNTTGAVRSYQISACKDWKVAVDSSLLIYQIVTAVRSGGNETVNANGELTSHLTGICRKVLGFLANRITPIFVFDGKSPDIKRVTTEIRAANCKKACDKLTALDPQSEEYNKHHARAFHASPENFEEARILLSLLGIPYINAPGEADIVCSWLASRRGEDGKRHVVGVATEDSDMLPLGARYLFKNMLQAVTSREEFTLISLSRALKELDVTMEQFVDICVLLGTDFNKNIKGVGPVAVAKLMKQYGSLEKIIEVYRKKNPTEDFEANVQCMILAKNYLMTSLDELDKSDFTVTSAQLNMRRCQRNNLIDFLVNKHGFDASDIIRNVNMIIEYQDALGITADNEYPYVPTGLMNEKLEYENCEYVFE